MNQSEAPPTAGLVNEKYQLVRMIGRGGMGSVWEARHASLGTQVAIKFIEAEYADSQEARKRFDNEAKAAATIQSKHAIQIYDHGVTPEGKPYIVMELLNGQPLDKRIEQAGRLSLQDTARIIQQVCRGLARAHERGIVHRDLKPENIFLVTSPDEDGEIAKVLDFGIAKLSNNVSNPGISSSTKTGAVLGTPFYMSPEQARGLRNVDHRTDVWSLGVIAFKCITGKLPFDGESVGDLLVKICTAPVPIPSHSVPGLPSSFDVWFQRALEREPERRFSTVSELSEALSVAAGMAPRSSQVNSSGQGHNLGQMPTAAVGAVGAVHQGMSTPQGLGPPPPQQMIQTPPPGATPFGQGQQGYGASYQARSQTPNPAGMTNAPFTSSVEGQGGGKGKLLFGLVAVLAIAAGVVVAVKFGIKPEKDAATDGARLTTPPPAVSSVAEPVPSEKPAEKPPENNQGATTIAANATPPPATPPTPTTKPAVVTKPAGKPSTTPPKTTPTAPPATTTVAVTPTAPPAPTPTPAKKPPRNPSDPGY